MGILGMGFEVLATLVGSYALLLQISIIVYNYFLQYASELSYLARTYFFAEAVVLQFGSRSIFRTQCRILEHADPKLAMDFKKATQDESQMITIAGTILAQIAITALSLDNLSRAHWVARGFFTFSLVASIISVYYASNQYQILTRCLNAEQVRRWIRGGIRGGAPLAESPSRKPRPENAPSVAAVLTLSAPSALLSLSVHSFIIGLGIYLGFVWTRDLDPSASNGDSKAVFITYIVSTTVCYCVYSLSNIIVSEEDEFRAKEAGIETNSTPCPACGEPRSHCHELRDRTNVGRNDEPRDLVHTMREAARLRRELAVLDNRVADYLEARAQNETDGRRAPLGATDV